jgi:hypothetical protein
MNWLHESAGPVAVLDTSDRRQHGQSLSAAVDMSKFHQVTFVFLLGDMANETIDAGVYESDASGGTYTALSGKQATQLAAGGIGQTTTNKLSSRFAVRNFLLENATSKVG